MLVQWKRRHGCEDGRFAETAVQLPPDARLSSGRGLASSLAAPDGSISCTVGFSWFCWWSATSQMARLCETQLLAGVRGNTGRGYSGRAEVSRN